MAHILDLSANIQNWLNRSQLGTMTPRIIFSGKALEQVGTTPNGYPVFSSTPQSVVWDLSPYAPVDAVKINQSKPVIPGQGKASQFTATRATVKIINPASTPWIGVSQDGAVMDLSTIETGELRIEVSFSGISDQIVLFVGKVQAPPIEREQESIFKIHDLTFENVKRAVHFDNFAEFNGVQSGEQTVSGMNGVLNARAYTVNTPGGSFKAYNGALTFDEVGDLITTFENNDPDKMDLQRIGITNGAKPGPYTIKFESATGYRLTYPDNEEYRGNINTALNILGVAIAPNDWTGADGTGVEIKFFVACCNWQGNPGTMIMTLMERMYLANYGELPGTNPLTTTLPIDWTAFKDFEREHKAFRVWVSLTNEDASVWELRSGSLPITYMRLAQQIADHCFASIYIKANGQISIQGPRQFDDLKTLSTADWIRPGFEIQGPPTGVKYNLLQIKYAANGRSGSYGVTEEVDLRANDTIKALILSIPLPFYKAGYSANVVAWILELIERRYINNPQTFSIPVTASFGIAARPGDRFRVVSNVQPKGEWNVEISRVNGKGPAQDLTLRGFALGEIEGPEFILCSSDVGDGVV